MNEMSLTKVMVPHRAQHTTCRPVHIVHSSFINAVKPEKIKLKKLKDSGISNAALPRGDLF